MTEREMFEKSFDRPRNFFSLSSMEQWEIDKNLGILDWLGTEVSELDMIKFECHYDELPKRKRI